MRIMTIADEFAFKASLVIWMRWLSEYRGHKVCIRDEVRPHLLDDNGVRWLLDGSGECA